MSAAFVVDCSIAMAWLFNDGATPKTRALLNRYGRPISYFFAGRRLLRTAASC